MKKGALSISLVILLAAGAAHGGDRRTQQLTLKMLQPSINSLEELNEESNVVQKELPVKLKEQNWKHQISYEYRASTLSYEEFYKQRVGFGD